MATAGLPSTPFVYQDYGNLATIGRMAAVVDLRGLKFSLVLGSGEGTRP